MERNESLKQSTPESGLVRVAALVLMAVVVLSYRQRQQFKRANVDAAQTRDVVDSFERLLSSLGASDFKQGNNRACSGQY